MWRSSIRGCLSNQSIFPFKIGIASPNMSSNKYVIENVQSVNMWPQAELVNTNAVYMFCKMHAAMPGCLAIVRILL